MQELKSCPFCGGGAQYTESVNGSNMVYVGCCKCSMRFSVQKAYCGTTPDALKNDLIKGWNTRTPERESGSHWQPIETAPKDGVCIIGRNSDGEVYRMLRDSADEEWWMFDGDQPAHPVNWMPLPTTSIEGQS